MDSSSFDPEEDEDSVTPKRRESRIGDTLYLEIFNTIIDECVDELSILESIFKQQHLKKQIVVYESLATRFGSGEKEEQLRQQYRIDDVYTNHHKLQKEVALLMDILCDASEDLMTEYSFREFELTVESLEVMMEEDRLLLVTEQANQKKMHDLKNQCKKMHEDNKKKLNEVDTKLYFAKLECDRVSTYLGQQMKYILQWEDSRIEQQEITNQRREDGYLNKTQDTLVKIDHEQKCHQEILNYIEGNEKELKAGIEYWLNKYDTDLDLYDNQILRMKIQQQKILEERVELQGRYEQRIKDMAAWIEYKWQKAVEMWQFKVSVKAAMKIQAWWRETMMRCFLGPYRKKSKKKKGKNKKKDG